MKDVVWVVLILLLFVNIMVVSWGVKMYEVIVIIFSKVNVKVKR